MDNKVLEKIDEKEKVKQNCYNDKYEVYNTSFGFLDLLGPN